jgi:ATP phosphoribosyltransferase regulatory subunit
MFKGGIQLESFKFLIPNESNGVIIKNVSMLRKIEEELRNVFLKYDYKETMTPTFEFMDLYKSIYKNINYDQTFNFINDKGENIALRWDFTIPLARYYVSQNKNNPEVARYSYFGKVFRKPIKLSGKMSECYQVGIELINVPEIDGEKEILDILTETLPFLNLKRLKIELGSSSFFNRIFELTGEKEELIQILAKKNISEMRDFVNNNNFDSKLSTLLLKLPRMCGTVSILDNLITYIDDPVIMKSVEELKKLHDIISTNNKEYEVIFDLSMVPNMDYYSGFMFKVYSEYVPDPIIAGGRYDRLLEKFGKDVPAIGFAYYLDNIVKSGKKESEANVENSNN